MRLLKVIYWECISFFYCSDYKSEYCSPYFFALLSTKSYVRIHWKIDIIDYLYTHKSLLLSVFAWNKIARKDAKASHKKFDQFISSDSLRGKKNGNEFDFVNYWIATSLAPFELLSKKRLCAIFLFVYG